jgi:hypothetical protein
LCYQGTAYGNDTYGFYLAIKGDGTAELRDSYAHSGDHRITIRLGEGQNAWKIIKGQNGRELIPWTIKEPTYQAMDFNIYSPVVYFELVKATGESGQRHYRYRVTNITNPSWTDWSTEVPKVQGAFLGTDIYEVQWYSDISEDWLPAGSADNPAQTVTVRSVTENSTGPTLNNYSGTYDGNAHGVTATGAAGGTVYYRSSTDNANWSNWSTTAPTRTDAGVTYVQAYTRGDEKHADSDPVSAQINIAKKEIDVIAPPQLEATYGQTLKDVAIPNPQGNEKGIWYGRTRTKASAMSESIPMMRISIPTVRTINTISL